MRSRTVFAISLLLISVGQLPAQTTDRAARDPFGPDVIIPNTAASTRRKSDSSPRAEPPDRTKKRASSQPDDLFPPVVVVSVASAAHQRIERALNRETTFDYLDQPLKDVVEDISFSNGIPIIIDTRALEDFGIDTGSPITMSLKGVSMRAALRLMLRELELTFVIQDEVLQITTPEAAESATSIRFYHVTELLPSNGDGKVLVELIKTLVAPNTWCGSDSVGSIIYIEHLESLAIRQTNEVFHEIEELLATTKQVLENQLSKDRTPSPGADPFN